MLQRTTKALCRFAPRAHKALVVQRPMLVVRHIRLRRALALKPSLKPLLFSNHFSSRLSTSTHARAAKSLTFSPGLVTSA